MIFQKKMDWYVGYMHSEAALPEKRVPATVPGAVQLDWAKAEGWGDYSFSDNYKSYLWMEDVYWSYSAKVELPDYNENDHLIFVCKGIDYRFKVKLDGTEIHAQEGMFTPFEIDLTDRIHSGIELEILIFPVPKREGAEHGRQEADQCCKPALSYGWDWHPRLVPSGIWDEAYLEVRPGYHIEKVETFYDLNSDLKKVDMKLNAAIKAPEEGVLIWELFDPDGCIVRRIEHPFSESSINEQNILLDLAIDNPRLWWPNGQGEPALYSSVVKLFDKNSDLIQKEGRKIGFRNVSLVMHPGAWDKPCTSEYPKTRSDPPITLEINGRQIFCKGTNWVNPEIFPGIITEETYRPLIQMAKDANFNILRSWGGGIINKDAFFKQCDEQGVMVWQEFPLACNNYVGTPKYLEILDQESRSIIKRLRSHPCVVLWCGGNELFNAWSMMTDQSHALRLLNRNCYDLDPKTPFIMTSPQMGMGHGNYLFKDFNDKEVFYTMPRSSNTAYAEFGCPGPSSVEYLRRIIPEEELFPPKPGTAWETHHAFGAWIGDTHLCLSTQEEYFGVPDTLEEVVERGQLLQNEGYKCIFEEARRQKPICSMALNWCYNEPWPSAANNSLINWPAEPKPAYYAVKASCRPVLASARISKFSWCEGEIFDPEIWILNDSPKKVEAKKVSVYLQIGDNTIFLLQWDTQEILPDTNLPGPVIRFRLPHSIVKRMKLILKVEGCTNMDSEYVLLYKSGELKEKVNMPRRLNT